jgi:hypothetical protein
MFMGAMGLLMALLLLGACASGSRRSGSSGALSCLACTAGCAACTYGCASCAGGCAPYDDYVRTDGVEKLTEQTAQTAEE